MADTFSLKITDKVLYIQHLDRSRYDSTDLFRFNDDKCNTQNISVLGKLRFDDLQSANHVAYKSGYLYLAAGLGGVKVIRVDVE